MNESELVKNPPTTVKELGIHLVYISDELRSIKADMKGLPSAFASVKDVANIETRVTKLETRQNLKNTLLWVGLVASAIINIVVIYQLFTGG